MSSDHVPAAKLEGVGEYPGDVYHVTGAGGSTVHTTGHRAGVRNHHCNHVEFSTPGLTFFHPPWKSHWKFILGTILVKDFF